MPVFSANLFGPFYLTFICMDILMFRTTSKLWSKLLGYSFVHRDVFEINISTLIFLSDVFKLIFTFIFFNNIRFPTIVIIFIIIWISIRLAKSGYDRYNIGIVIRRYIGIGRYIGFADKENVLSLSVSLSADTDFYIGFLPIW